jgi:hypothetical protein
MISSEKLRVVGMRQLTIHDRKIVTAFQGAERG